MPVNKLDKNNLAKTEDWYGNNIAVTCPVCGKVFIASGLTGKRECPVCHKATAYVNADGSEARVEW